VVQKDDRLQVAVEPDRLDRWRLEAERRGFSSLSDWVRVVLDGAARSSRPHSTDETHNNTDK